MRLTSQIWVSAFVRGRFSVGGFAAVLRRGAAEAGAIFIVQRKPAGLCDVFAPAPQTEFDAARPADRKFERVAADQGDADVAAYLDRQVAFDPDCWIVEFDGATLPDTIVTID